MDTQTQTPTETGATGAAFAAPPVREREETSGSRRSRNGGRHRRRHHHHHHRRYLGRRPLREVVRNAVLFLLAVVVIEGVVYLALP